MATLELTGDNVELVLDEVRNEAPFPPRSPPPPTQPPLVFSHVSSFHAQKSPSFLFSFFALFQCEMCVSSPRRVVVSLWKRRCAVMSESQNNKTTITMYAI